MGGDTPLDIEDDFEDRFDERVPTAEEGLDFLNSVLHYDEDIAKSVTAFLLIQRGAPMSDEVRRLALEGIAGEDTSDWDDPAKRDAVLADFKLIVEVYPAEGGKVELPHQPGLFEKIFSNLS